MRAIAVTPGHAGSAGLDDRAEFERAYYDYWARLVPDAEKGEFFTPEVWAQARDWSPFDRFRETLQPAAELIVLGGP